MRMQWASAGLRREEQDSKLKLESQGRKAYLLLQVGHLLHSFHGSWQRLEFKEEIL